LIDAAQGARLSRRLGVKGADAAAADARKLREWSREWLERWRNAPHARYEDELETLNAYLSRESLRREVVTTKDGLELRTHAQLDESGAILALLAAMIAALVTEEDASLLRTCAGPACTLWFLDRTKAHRRLFCSTATCGNRAKVAAFRERQRE
jgi:predicted RNA-binding Zn ribbon-like protein